MGWVFPSVPALAANSVEAHEEGSAAGTIGAAQGLGLIVGPLVGIVVYGFDTGAPFLLVAVMVAVMVLWPQADARAVTAR